MGFRWIAEKVEAGTLALHGWWFNMTEGQLYAFNPATAVFEPVQGVKLEPTVVKGTSLSAIKPDRFISAVAGGSRRSEDPSPLGDGMSGGPSTTLARRR